MAPLLIASVFANGLNFEKLTDAKVKLDEGTININIEPKPELFYKVLSKQCSVEIKSDFGLISYIKELTYAKNELYILPFFRLRQKYR